MSNQIPPMDYSDDAMSEGMLGFEDGGIHNTVANFKIGKAQALGIKKDGPYDPETFEHVPLHEIDPALVESFPYMILQIEVTAGEMYHHMIHDEAVLPFMFAVLSYITERADEPGAIEGFAYEGIDQTDIDDPESQIEVIKDIAEYIRLRAKLSNVMAQIAPEEDEE